MCLTALAASKQQSMHICIQQDAWSCANRSTQPRPLLPVDLLARFNSHHLFSMPDCLKPPLTASHCTVLRLQDAADSLWGSLAGAQFGLSGAASTGEVAAVILVKLIMDLYVTAGPRAAFPLALLLLQVRCCC